MKYFYLMIAVLSVIFLIFIIRNNPNNQNRSSMENPHKNIPDDSIHKNLFQGFSPSKENVSEAFRKKLRELENKLKSNPGDVETATELGDLYLSAHQDKKAIEVYETVRNKLQTESLFNLTLAYYNIKNFDKAEEVTKFILKKKPDEYRAIFNLGSINATKGNKELARKYWNEVIEKFPDTEEAKQAREFLARLK